MEALTSLEFRAWPAVNVAATVTDDGMVSDQRVTGQNLLRGNEVSGNLLMPSRFPHRFLPPIFSTRSPKKNNGILRMSSTSERGLCSAICMTSMSPNQSVRSANHCIVLSDQGSEMI